MDLALGTDRSYSLVTTVIRRRDDRCKLIQLDLHLRSGAVRIRFEDLHALWQFSSALDRLFADVVEPDPMHYSPVLTRLYTESDDDLEQDQARDALPF